MTTKKNKEKKKKKASPTPIRKDPPRKKSGKTNLTLAHAPEKPAPPPAAPPQDEHVITEEEIAAHEETEVLDGETSEAEVEAVDAEEDFDEPTRDDGSGTPEVAPGEVKEEEGSSLFVKQPPAQTVAGNRLVMHYLKPTLTRTKSGTRMIAMHLSLALTEEHMQDGLLPERIRDQWDLMDEDEGRTKLELKGVPPQRVRFYMDKVLDDVKLELPSAEVTNVQLAVIEKKGDGEAQVIIRLSFRLEVPVSPEVESFAITNFGNPWWVQMEEKEESLL